MNTTKSDLVVLVEVMTNAILDQSAPTLPDMTTAGIGTLESLYMGFWMEYLYANNLVGQISNITDSTDMDAVDAYVRDSIDVEETPGNSLAKVAALLSNISSAGSSIDSFIDSCYSIEEQQIDDFIAMTSGTPDSTKLIPIPTWFFRSLAQRGIENYKVLTFPPAGTDPTSQTYIKYLRHD